MYFFYYLLKLLLYQRFKKRFFLDRGDCWAFREGSPPEILKNPSCEAKSVTLEYVKKKIGGIKKGIL